MDINANAIKGFLVAVGILLASIGGQPVMNWITGDRSIRSIWFALMVFAFGLICILVGFFWTPSVDSKSRFVETLNAISVDARTYAALVVMIWLYFMVQQLQRNNEIVTLRNDVQSIARVIDRGVLPRHLAKSQQVTISEFLLQFQSYEANFQVVKGEEASSYMTDIIQAIKKGGWTVGRVDYIEGYVPEGLRMEFEQTQEHSQQLDDLKNPKPNRILQMALGLAVVRLNGGGGRSGASITKDSLIVIIGGPRRDSYEVTPPSD
jgi:hypothetical protein